MRQKAGTPKPSAEKIIKDIRRVTRKQYGAEEKIRIVLDGLRGEDSQVTTSISLSSTCDYSAPKEEGQAKTTNRRSKRGGSVNRGMRASNDWTSALVGSRPSVRPVQMSEL